MGYNSKRKLGYKHKPTVNSRAKGQRGEREFRDVLNKYFPGSSIRSQQYCGANGDADVICDALPGFHIEVKRTETFSMRKYCKQARDDCDARIARELKNAGVDEDISPLLVHKFNGGKWMAVIEADKLLGLLKNNAEMSKYLDMSGACYSDGRYYEMN